LFGICPNESYYSHLSGIFILWIQKYLNVYKIDYFSNFSRGTICIGMKCDTTDWTIWIAYAVNGKPNAAATVVQNAISELLLKHHYTTTHGRRMGHGIGHGVYQRYCNNVTTLGMTYGSYLNRQQKYEKKYRSTATLTFQSLVSGQ